MDLLSGLLGGIQGGAGAVTTLSEERRKALAEQVKMEALDLMNKRQQERGFAHSKDLQQGQFSHAEGMQSKGFEHAEGLLGKQLGSAERRHRETLAAKGDSESAPLASKDAHNKINEVYKALIDKGKWKEGQKLPGWAMTQINTIRRDAGMPELAEEETKVPKWFGARTDTKYQYSDGVLPSQGVVEPTPTERPTATPPPP